MGFFDSIGSAFDRITDFGGDVIGGAFASVGERFQGGRLSTGPAASFGRTLGAGLGNIVSDIGSQIIQSQVPVMVGTAPGPVPQPRLGGRFGTPQEAFRSGQSGVGRATATARRVPVAPITAAPEAPANPFSRVIEALGEGVDVARAIDTQPMEAGILPTLPIGQIIRSPLVQGAVGGALGAFFGGAGDDTAGSPLSGVVSPMEVPDPMLRSGGRVFSYHQNLLTGAVSARAQAFQVANPVTGAVTWFKPAGRPILWSGDLSAAKRVRKIAARAKRSGR